MTMFSPPGPEIIIAPLEDVPPVVARHGDAWVCGLLSPGMADSHPLLPLDEERRLKLDLHDVSAPRPGCQAATEEHMERLIRFVRRWGQAVRRGEAGPLVMHCWFAISRSPAAAFIAHCALREGEDEHALAQELRLLSPVVTPNARLVALADDMLGRGGRMRRAIAAIGRGAPASTGALVRWPLRCSLERRE